MNQPLCIRTDEVAPRPWRNGGGVTRELFVWPPAGEWRVRLSVANIDQDGPFSVFPGVERWFAVLAGEGVELTIDGQARCIRRGEEPLRFAGDVPVHCRLLAGSTRDLNLMLQDASGAMRVALDAVPWSPSPGQACGLYSLVAGRCEAENGAARTVAEHTLLWFGQSPALLRFVAAGDTGEAPVGYWLAAGTRA